MARILSPSDDAIEEAAARIRSGGLVAFPTETVYGLGADALDGRAAARIFEAKRRPHFDPLVVHLASVELIDVVARDVPAPARALVETTWPGPLTIVLPRRADLPEIVTSGLDTVAVRVPAHPVALALLDRAGVPVAAPSANPFGRLSPTTAQHVAAGLGDAVDIVLDGGPCRWGVESTILTFVGEPTILRFGATPVEVIEERIGPVARRLVSSSQPEAPGQLLAHYAPRRAKVHVVDGAAPTEPRDAAAYVAFARAPDASWGRVEVLSPGGDLREASARLFAVLHALDAEDLDAIYVERVPDEGLGRAINDRILRAAAS